MAEENSAYTRTATTLSNGCLAAPSTNTLEPSQARSNSPSTSHRTSQSRQTSVEERETDSETRKTLERRQQTFKLRRDFSRMMFFKGFLSPKKGMQMLERLVVISQLDVPDDRMFYHERTPFTKDVWITPKNNGPDDHKALCLLDTGCFQGNIISKRLVEVLGYAEADYEPLSETESFGSTTLSGEHISFEGVIRLSWHHNTSTHRYHHMRFLVSTTTHCEMIIGVRSITKYQLLREMVMLTQRAATNVQADHKLAALNDRLSKLKSSIENYKKGIKEEESLPEASRDKKKIAQYKKELAKKEHQYYVQDLRVDARDAELYKEWKVAESLNAKADKEERLWNEKHPSKKPSDTSNTSPSTQQTAPTPKKSSKVSIIGPSTQQAAPSPSSSAKKPDCSCRQPV